MAEVRAAIDPIDLRSFPPVDPLTQIPESWRQTFLSKYVECPRAAYLYAKYNGGAFSHPLAGGTLLHRAIERFLQHLIDSDERTGNPETAKDILNEVLVESTDLTVSPERFDKLRGMMFHIAEGVAINPANVVCLETPVWLDVNGRKVSGTIDFAEANDTRCVVLDWKSAFLNPPRPIEEEGDVYMPTTEEWLASFQLVLYSLSLATGSIDGSPFGLSHIEEFVLRQIHPRQFWDNEGTVAYREAIITREALLDWRFYLEALVAQLEEAFRTWEFPAIIGSHCDYCPASAECPIPAPLREYRGEIRTVEDAERAAIQWERHTRRRKELWEAIKGFAKASGHRIRYGADLELYWRTIEGEKLRDYVTVPGSKKKIKGRVALKENIQRTREWGHPLDWETYFTPTISTRLMRRKLTDTELAAEKDAAASKEAPG
jgi:PD-(D/E)XK nuclease superfamily